MFFGPRRSTHLHLNFSIIFRRKNFSCRVKRLQVQDFFFLFFLNMYSDVFPATERDEIISFSTAFTWLQFRFRNKDTNTHPESKIRTARRHKEEKKAPVSLGAIPKNSPIRKISDDVNNRIEYLWDSEKKTLAVTTVTSVYKGESFDHLLLYDKEFLLTSKTIDKLFSDGTFDVRINLNCCAQVYTCVSRMAS